MAVNIGPRIGIDGESEYRKQINGIIQQAKTLASEMKVVAASFDKNTSAQDKAAATGKVLEKQIDVQRQRVQALTEMLRKSVKETGENSTATLKWQQAVNEATADLKNMERELKESADATDDVGDALEKAEAGTFSFGDALKANILAQAVVDGIKRLASEIRDLVGDIVQTGMSFDASMSGVKAISGATEQEFESLRQKALELAQGTQFTATETADAMKYMAMAGWDASDMMGGLEGVMNLATASGEDLATVSDIVTDALTAFGLGAEDSTHFADVLAVAASNANTNVSMMGDTFRYVAPLAGAMGYSAEDTALAIGIMANSGIKASQAGTALRSILTRMANPTKDSAAAMDALGISVTNSDGSMKSLGDVIDDLRAGFSGLSEQEQASYAAMLGGQEAMSGLLAIVNATETDLDGLTEAISNSNGAAQDMAATMTDNLAGNMDRLNSALETAKISIADQMAPVLRDFVQQITDEISNLVNSINWEEFGEKIQNFVTLITENGPFIVSIISGIAAGMMAWNVATMIHGVVDAVRAYQTATNGASIAQALFNTAVKGNPIGAIISLIVGAVAAIVALWHTNEGFRNAVISAFKAVYDTIKSVVKAIWGFFTETIPEAFSKAVDFITSLPGKAIQWGKDMIQGFVDGVLDKARALIDAVKGVVDKVRGFLHFSRPDEGPLRDYETWMPDMMRGLARGITANAWRLEEAASFAAGSISIAPPVVPAMQLAGGYGAAGQAGGSVTNLGGITIQVYGAEGQDINALADIVMEKMETKVQQIGGAWA